MGQVTVRAQRTIDASADRALAALANYVGVRPMILTEQYGDYRVESGGYGAGTRVHWTLRATRRRVREQLVEVTEPAADRIVERDTNSSMVTTWTVAAAGPGRSTVSVETTWDGAIGIGGFFERTFAPKGLRRIHDRVLSNLDDAVRD